MEENIVIIDVLSSVTALIAVVISLLSYFNSKRKTTVENITINRMEWIKEVRKYCGDFLIEFNKKEPNIEELEDLYIKIQLYGSGTTYDELFDSLSQCIMFVKDTDSAICTEKSIMSQNVLKNSQKILNGVWWRMKREAGISALKDKIIAKKYKKIYK